MIPYLEIADVDVNQTRVHMKIDGGNIFFQASVAGATELGYLLEEYGKAVPKKRKKGVALRTVTVAGDEDEHPEEALVEKKQPMTEVALVPAGGVKPVVDPEAFGEGSLFDGEHDDDDGGLFGRGGGGANDALFD